MKRGLFILFIVLLAGSLSAQYLPHRRKAFRSPAFSPSDVAGMIAWYAADDISSSDGTEQTSWSDLSGNGYTLTAATGTGPTWETAEVNGLPAMLFNGTSDFMTNNTLGAVFTGTDLPMTAFIVTKKTDNSGNDAYFSWTSNSDGDTLGEVDSNAGKIRWVVRDDVATLGLKQGTTDTSTTAYELITVNTSGTATEAWLDGAVEWTSSAADVGLLTTTRFTVGARNDGGALGSYLSGLIAELIIYDSALGATDRGNVETYLADKYGITLP